MNKNLSVVRQQFAQCVFNHKIYEKASDRFIRIDKRIKWINMGILSLVIAFLVLQLKFSEESVYGNISIAITVFEILFLYLQKEFSFEEKAQAYKKIAIQYLSLRDKYKNFIVDIVNQSASENLLVVRNYLLEEYQIISTLAPGTEHCDYKEAQLSLLKKCTEGEEYTWSDDEINIFLPKELHL